MKKLVIILAMITSLSCFGSEVFTIGDFQYEILDGKTCVIRRYIGNSTNVVIPNDVDYNGRNWSINWSLSLYDADFSKISIESVVIPPSMTTIQSFLFRNCTSLKKITFLGNVTTIENEAFYNCGFEEFVVPNTVIQIGRDAFSDCKNLKSIWIPASVQKIGVDILSRRHGWSWVHDGTSFDCDVIVSSESNYFSSKDGILFNKDKSQLLYYPPMKKDTKYQIPESVRTIGNSAFANSQLEEIIIPSSVTDIGDAAFTGCKKLKSVSLPQLKTISSYLLSRSSIESITIPHSVTTIGEWAFEGCNKLKSVVMDGENLEYINEKAFYECSSLVSIAVPNSVKHIGKLGFCGCTNLRRVILPDNIYLYDGCFYLCPNIEEIRGYTILYPESLESSFHESGSPFYKNVIKNLPNIRKSFSYFAYGKVNKAILEWQKKKEYETTEQWRLRVTEEKRQQKVNELLDEARKEYVANNAPNTFNGTLGNYDADYNTFPLKVGEQQMLFISVPQSDAPLFKEKWNKVKISPTYGIVNDYVGVLSCTFTLKGKTYNLSKTYNNDNADNLALNLSPFELNFGDNREEKASSPITIDNSLDLNIPSVSSNNTITFAVIIGNERYTRVAQVPYANNDARIFAEYCKKTLGLPDKNVKVYENATYGTMIGAVSDIQKIAKAFKGDANIIFYYAGHGIPDEATGDGYLLPIDADGLNMRVCYPLSQLYKELGEMQARSVTCFLDACFSGSQRGNGMVVAARGVAIKAKSNRPTGHTIVFTAATDKQTAYPYKEKGHGMFTYYLLKKLRDTKGDCTLGELGSYICDEVAKQAVVTNGKEQTPVVLTSDGVLDDWKNMKLK